MSFCRVSTTVFVSPFVVFNMIHRDALQQKSSSTSRMFNKFVFILSLNDSNIENEIIAQNVEGYNIVWHLQFCRRSSVSMHVCPSAQYFNTVN